MQKPMAPGPRIAALDGFRGFAILAVCAFHFGVPGVGGGFLGVDVFYVLSGYLITTLLVKEFERTATVRLGAFWARRARRLLPALFLMLAAAMLYVRYVALSGTYPGFRGDALATLLYFSNWHQITTSANYFVATGPVSLLTHTWSLAIEEQFYLVWPPLVWLGLHLVRPFRRAVWVLLAVSVAGAMTSQALMTYGSMVGWSPTRLYFGTDTHAMSVLVGGALALTIVLSKEPFGRQVPWRLFGVVAFVGIILTMVTASGDATWMFRFGFLLVALLTALVLAAVRSEPDRSVAAGLSFRPLAWLGLISYGVYLWHFPVWVALTPARVHLSGYSLIAVQFLVSVGIATISYYAIERPVMTGTFWRSARALPVAGVVTAGIAALIVLLTATPRADGFSAVPRYRAAAGAPHRVVILGDSTALTLGVALKATAPVGMRVDNAALWGCGLSISESEVLTRVSWCNQSTPVSHQWPAVDARAVASTGPGDQVLFLAGHWETGDVVFANGEIGNLGQLPFRRYEARQLETLYKVATAHGAHLDLLTMPAIDTNYTKGRPPPATDAPRTAIYNQLLMDLAREHPDRVSVIPYARILSPSGKFEFEIDGVQVRTADGIHTPAYVPGDPFSGDTDNAAMAHRFYAWIEPRLWPLIINPPRPR